MIVWKKDIATRIFFLSLEIKHLMEENNIGKQVVIDDFIELITSNFEEEKNEDN